jgi:aminodeoxychorismate synthase component I
MKLASGGARLLPAAGMEEIKPRIRLNPARLDGMTPAEVAAALSHLPGLVFFDSAGNLPSSATRSISVIAARPVRILRGSIHDAGDRNGLRAALADAPPSSGDHGFPLGGLCGWVDYEGAFVFGDFPEMLVFDHHSQTWRETGDLSTCLGETAGEPVRIGHFHPQTTRARFLEGVGRIKEWIAAGDIYQVNLAQSFEAGVSGGSLFGLYETLRDASPAPMAAWLALDGREVLCSSPETFLKISGRGIETRPIKGTRPRFADPDEDRRSAYELQTSAKEIAELVMITDLLRNDLGQVCEFGSVEVSEMLQLESLAQVHHLVSTVTGSLRPEIDAIGALAACFPGGSITGAPKKRAMEIIRELEGTPRGIYCGAIGWLGYHGESSFNIAIRTLVREGDRLSYQVGAGIVADSDPAGEYEETLQKAAGIRLAVERWTRAQESLENRRKSARKLPSSG